MLVLLSLAVVYCFASRFNNRILTNTSGEFYLEFLQTNSSGAPPFFVTVNHSIVYTADDIHNAQFNVPVSHADNNDSFLIIRVRLTATDELVAEFPSAFINNIVIVGGGPLRKLTIAA